MPASTRVRPQHLPHSTLLSLPTWATFGACSDSVSYLICPKIQVCWTANASRLRDLLLTHVEDQPRSFLVMHPTKTLPTKPVRANATAGAFGLMACSCQFCLAKAPAPTFNSTDLAKLEEDVALSCPHWEQLRSAANLLDLTSIAATLQFSMLDSSALAVRPFLECKPN